MIMFLERKKYFLKTYLFLEGKGERERNIHVWLPLACPLLGTQPATQAWALDWELSKQPFGSQAGTQSTEPYQPGLERKIFNLIHPLISSHQHHFGAREM